MPDEPAATRAARERMVATQIRARGVRDPRVLNAMATVPRHLFVPQALRDLACDDRPLPLDAGQTISQPYIVAYMTEQLSVAPDHRVLEIGTGSGYQTAILAELAREVWTVEVVAQLARTAAETLAALGYRNVHTLHGSGWDGWPDAAPFDRVLITAAPPEVPAALEDQLEPEGILVAPVGDESQHLVRLTRTPDGRRTREDLLAVRFVPMVR